MGRYENGEVRAAVLAAPGQLSIKVFPRPQIGPAEALLRVEAAGVCGTDPKIYRGKVTEYPFPLILGHEIVGRIEEVGPEAAAAWGVVPGDRLLVESRTSCGVCMNCLQGKRHACRQRRTYGTFTPCTTPPYLWGAYAELMYLPLGANVHRVPADLTPEEAVLVPAALANGVDWTGLGGVSLGDVVVVQGVGMQGLACCLAARERGAGLIIASGLSRDRVRLEMAMRLGADRIVDVEQESLLDVVRAATGGEMANVVMEVSGSPKAARLAVDLVGMGGTIVQAGLTGSHTETPLPLDQILRKKVRLQGVHAKRSESIRQAMWIIQRRRRDLEGVVTHRYPLDAAEHALQVTGGEVPGDEPIKVVLFPNQRG